MSEQTIGSLTQRLECLERTNRRFKLIGSSVLVAIATLILMGQAKPTKVTKVLEAEEFILRDPSGKIRARLGMGDLGRTDVELIKRGDFEPVALNLFDKNGVARTRLSASDFSALYMAGRDGVDRAWLEVGDSPVLVFRDELRNQRLVFGGFTLWSTVKAGGQYIDLKGSGERRPTSSLVLMSEDGKVLWKAP